MLCCHVMVVAMAIYSIQHLPYFALGSPESYHPLLHVLTVNHKEKDRQNAFLHYDRVEKNKQPNTLKCAVCERLRVKKNSWLIILPQIMLLG